MEVEVVVWQVVKHCKKKTQKYYDIFINQEKKTNLKLPFFILM